ncbi:hypothetical protein M2347_002849 [Chryseobacterium sp. H1D6B]|uniref:hypothetical protein n=1 Tax=Chryseobacterium sp. H1D6B TaxID=2940588 RepID=UPI0015C70DBE|nr:hypothetical protein [Chryseobacterium sp. H1D6B]MDH6253122.1 hypothetical protein [Chryseobacterium sp. H1D6B]
MKKIIITSLFLIVSCKEQQKQPQPEIKAAMADETPVADQSEEAKKWLETSIEKFFKTDLSVMDLAMRDMTTKDYYEYKTDAANVDMDTDGSLTEKEFRQKWESKFNTEKAGTGVGFLISGQDWNEIKVSKCQFVSQNGNTYLFDIILEDKEYNAKYPVQVRVVKEKEGFRIADVFQ